MDEDEDEEMNEEDEENEDYDEDLAYGEDPLDVAQRQYEDEDDIRNHAFADPNGRSALRASSKSNPRNLPCPNCGRKNVLTPADRAKGYQCDTCADAQESGRDY